MAREEKIPGIVEARTYRSVSRTGQAAGDPMGQQHDSKRQFGQSIADTDAAHSAGEQPQSAHLITLV